MGVGPFRIGGRLPKLGCLPLLGVLVAAGFVKAHLLIVVLLLVAVALCVAVAAKEGRLPHQQRKAAAALVAEAKTEPIPVIRRGGR